MINFNNSKGAYFLGWMYSDGNIRKEIRTKNSYIVKLKIIATDEKVLNNFSNITKWSITYESNKKYVTMRKTNEELGESLLHYGLLPRKSYENSLLLKLPKINEEYIPYFLRGFLEGDGYVTMNSKNIMIVGLCGVNLNLFNQIQEYLNKQNIESKIYFKKNSHKGIYVLKIQKKLDAYNFLKLIYNDQLDMVLERKYIKIKTYFELYNSLKN
jgi:intein-encoded DNA endonuclease-like protein